MTSNTGSTAVPIKSYRQEEIIIYNLLYIMQIEGNA